MPWPRPTCVVRISGSFLYGSHNPARTRPASLKLSKFPRPPSSPTRPSLRLGFATMAPIERLAEDLEAPALDDRSYRVVRLPNQLEALLVHDPETDKASAAVNVNVGSFSDADDMPGMAHAVEHLLFMGTEKVCRSDRESQGVSADSCPVSDRERI